MAAIKRQVYGDLERGLLAATADADELMLKSFTAPDFVEGVQSFLDRRDPRFEPLSAGESYSVALAGGAGGEQGT
jgi:hypothetical protein